VVMGERELARSMLALLHPSGADAVLPSA
jgi:hypothetical protein